MGTLSIRQFIISVFVFICSSTAVLAQRVEQDSLWIRDVISNGGEYQLNPEVWDAIRNGTLLNANLPVSAPLGALPVMPVNTGFDLRIYHLPNSSFLYRYDPVSLLVVRSALIRDIDNVLVWEYYRIPHTSIEISAPGDDLFPQDVELINGEWEATIHPRTYATFSAEEGLEDLFEPTERHKRENRKKANAWKTYNMQEMEDY
ncbi:MAG: hypothetical protein LUG98_16275 [Tannerellaceae bacterium]|nr:hypothetical protein [Tannerellaceae bacterium]